MKKIALFVLLGVGLSSPAWGRQGFTVGMGPVGNIYLIDTVPILDPGVGGFMFFQYRFHEQVAFETSFMLNVQDGQTRTGQEDVGILFLGMPIFDVKFFLRQGDPRFDPYFATGLGMYWLTEGSRGNDTGGTGLGGQFGLGFDYYLNDIISLGFQGVFRSIALITDFGTPSQSTAVFPYSLMGSLAFHF